MNKIYRQVWNPSLRVWVAVSEFAKAKGKGKTGRTTLSATAAGVIGAVLAMSPMEEARAWMVNPSNVTNAGVTASDSGVVANTALGNSAIASGTGSVAIGSGAKSNDNQSIALGNNATAIGQKSIAIGYAAGNLSDTNAAYNVAIGYGAGQGVHDQDNVAVGTEAGMNVTGQRNVGVGFFAGQGVNGTMNMALGAASGENIKGDENATLGREAGQSITGSRNIAIGSFSGKLAQGSDNQIFGTNAAQGMVGSDNLVFGQSAANAITANRTISMGKSAKASADDAMALGSNALASASTGVALGANANATGASSIAMGTMAKTSGKYTLALGDNASASSAASAGAIALGVESNASFDGATAIGANSVASQLNAVAIGRTAKATGISSVALGDQTQATGDSGVAIGGGSIVSGDMGTAVGWYTKSTGDNSLAFGNKSTASGKNASVVGTNGIASGDSSIAMGNGAQATGVNSISIGTGNIVSGNNSAAIGDPSTITGTGSYSLGNNNTINADNTFVVGSNVSVGTGLNGSVVLGNNSTVSAAVGTASKVIGDKTYNFAGTAPVAAVSVGAVGAERTITNVAAGRLSETSTDAINGSQLYAVAADLNASKTHYYSVNDNGVHQANYENDGAAGLNALAVGIAAFGAGENSVAMGINSVATGLSSMALGQDTQANGESALAIGTGAKAHNVGDVALGAGSETAAAVGTNGVNINGIGYTFAGRTPSSTVSIGKAGEERTLTNMAAGQITATSTDGINGSQLFATNSAIKTLDDGAVKYDINIDGSVNYNSVTMGGDTYNSTTKTGGTKITNVADGSAPSDAVNFSQLTETNNRVQNIYETGTKYFHANSTGTDSVASGIDAIAIGMGAISDVARSVALGDGAKTEAAISTANTTIAGKGYTFSGITPVGTVSIGNAGGERTFTNMAAGRITATSTDGVNGSQLFATNSAINDLDKGAVKYDLNPDGTVNYNSVTMGGNTYNSTTKTGGTKITNVARGVDDSDAVNMSQLNETNQSVTDITDTVNNFAGDQSNEYTETHGRGIRYVRTNDTGLTVSDSSAEGQGSTAVGYNATSFGDNSLALGREAKAMNADDVALGSGAVTDIAVGTSGARIADVDYLFAGVNPLSTVSVGSRGSERTITNVAAGRLSTDSTDAVNGSQLFATNSAINTLDKGSVKYDINSDGTVNYNSITLAGDTYNNVTKQGGTRITNVAYGVDSSDAVNVQQLTDATTSIYEKGTKYFHANSDKADSVASGTDSIAVGPNAQSTGNGSIAMGDDAKSTGLSSTAIGQGAQTLGDKSVAMGAGAIANNAGDIALGAGSVTETAVATTGTTIAGNHYSFAGTAPTSTLSIGSEGNERTVTNMAAGRISATSTDGINGSQLYATNQAIESISGDITNLDHGAVKYETNIDGTVNYNKVIMGGDTYNETTHTGGTTITNVADGEAPSDAVNKYQLDQVDNKVTNISNGADGMFQVNNTSNLPKPKPTGKDAVAGGAGAVAGGDNSMAIGTNAKASHKNAIALGNNSVTDRDNSVSMGYAGGERQVTNVAAGTQGTDAANVSQLKQGINEANSYTNQKFGDLKNMVDDQKDKLSAGIAGAMAMAGLPQPYQPGASMVGLAGGTYQGESAVALGVSTISDNGKWVTKVSGTTNSKGDLGAAVGIGYQW